MLTSLVFISATSIRFLVLRSGSQLSIFTNLVQESLHKAVLPGASQALVSYIRPARPDITNRKWKVERPGHLPPIGEHVGGGMGQSNTITN